MAMPVVPEARRYTVEEVMSFPNDGNRYEVVHGELLVTPSPRALHQIVLMDLCRRLVGYLSDLGDPARVFAVPADITWEHDVYVQPDLFVVPKEQVTLNWRTYKNLLLVIEVLSPSSMRGDRLVKRRAYQENRVGTYWIVDADRRVVEVWHPDDEVGELFTHELRWRVAPAAPELVINLSDLWAALPSS